MGTNLKKPEEVIGNGLYYPDESIEILETISQEEWANATSEMNNELEKEEAHIRFVEGRNASMGKGIIITSFLQ